MKTIDIRRSIRNFKDTKVEKNKLEKILKAAMQAPSAYNQQAWEFIVLTNKEQLETLSQMSPYSKMLAKAPAAIIVLANQEKMRVPECWQQDLGAATQNILLEAVEQGLGSVWLANAPFEERMQYIKDMFKLPESIVPYSVVALGYSDQKNNYVDRFDDTKIHYDKW